MVEEAVFVMITSQLEGMVVIRMAQAALAEAAIYPVAEEHLHLVVRLAVPVLFQVHSDWVGLCVETTEEAEGEVGTEVGLLMLLVVEAAPVILLAPWSLMV